jgi:hypothetical protein
MTRKEDDLKILDVQYLSNHWSDLIQILNLSYGDKTKDYRSLIVKTTPMEDDPNGRRTQWKMTPMEDDLKVLKVEYLGNL